MRNITTIWINRAALLLAMSITGSSSIAQFLPDKTVNVDRIAVLQQIGKDFFSKPGYTNVEGYTKDSSQGQISFRSWKPELSDALVIRPVSDYATTWYSAIIPPGTAGRILLAFQVAIDLGSGRTFDIYLDGVKRFRFGQLDSTSWRIKENDGELAYYSMHVDPQGDGHGYLLMDIPAGWTRPGQAIRFEIKPAVRQQLADWFMVFRTPRSMASLVHEMNSYTNTVIRYDPRSKTLHIASNSANPKPLTLELEGRKIQPSPVQHNTGITYETVLKKAPSILRIFGGATELAQVNRFSGNFNSSYYKGANAVILDAREENGAWNCQVTTRYSPAASGYLAALQGSAGRKDTIYFMNSSHQDIAWMDDPEKCELIRDTLLVAPMIRKLKNDPGFRFDLEDVLTMREYVGRHPEDKAYLQEQLDNGRLNVGGSFNMSYEEMYGGESNVRQFYAGSLWMKKHFNYHPVTYWNMDVPGKTLQMPQLLAKAGIRGMMISRFKRGLYHWAAPDSSKVWAYSPGHYGDFYFAAKNEKTDGDIAEIAREVKQFSTYFPQEQPKKLPLLYDMDMTPGDAPHPFMAKWNGLPELPYLTYATSVDLLDGLDRTKNHVPVIYGERTALWLYIHGPGHHHALDASRKADVTLTAAEKFAAIDGLLHKDMGLYPAKRLEQAWEAKIYPDHGWGGRNGLTTDHTFLQKFRFALQESESILNTALQHISGRVETQSSKGLPLVVFNSLSWQRNDPVETDIQFKSGSFFSPVLTDASGRALPAQWSSLEYYPDGSIAAAHLSFVAEAVPSIGYKTFYLNSGKKEKPLAIESTKTVNIIDNEFFRLELDKGKIRSLRDKQLNKELLDAAKLGGAEVFTLHSAGDDAFEASVIPQPDMHEFDKTSLHAGDWRVVDDGEVFTTIESTSPIKYAAVAQRIRLYKHLKRIDFYITLKNWEGVLFREFRWNLPVSKTFKTLRYEVPFAVLEHGKDELPGTAGEKDTVTESVNIRPRGIENWIGAADGSSAITLSSSVAVADFMDVTEPANTDLTIQPVLLASRKSCHLEGPPYLQTGHHDYRFVLFSHADDNNLANRLGRQGNEPLRVVVNPLPYKEQGLPEELSFFGTTAPGVMISTVKKSEHNNNVALRLFEYGRQGKKVKVNSYFPLGKLWGANLLEERKSALPHAAKDFSVELGAAAIETFELGF